MSILYNFKVEKLKDRYKDHLSMVEDVCSDLYFEDISKLRDKGFGIVFIGLCSITTFIIFFYKYFTVLVCLLIILLILFLILFKFIIDDIIIPDKYKEIYEKSYYVYGYVITPSLIEKIDEFFSEPEKINEFLTSIKGDTILTERKCFKCRRKIFYVDYYRNNISTTPIQQLEKIWKSLYIQLYCCNCYKKKALLKNINKV